MPRKSDEEKKEAREFCAMVREWRIAVGLSQGDLAKRVNQSPSWVSMTERGEILPSPEMQQKLRRVLEKEESRRFEEWKRRKAQMGDVAREASDGKA